MPGDFGRALQAGGECEAEKGRAGPAIGQKAVDPTSGCPAAEPQELTGEPTNDDLFEPFPPIVLKTIPATGATDVDPSLTEIRVAFSKEMEDGSWSWVTLSKERFPEVAGKIRYEKA